jgi:hypothetical protein
MKTLRVGIASYEQMKARTLAIAQGEYKPPADEPKVWFKSAESFARVLSGRNRACLGSIAPGGVDGPAKIESLPDAEDHGATRLRSSQPRSAGLHHPASSVPADLVDPATVQPGARSGMIGGAQAPQHFLYFLPLPQGHGSFRPVFGVALMI